MDFQNRTTGRSPREYDVFQHYYVKSYNRYKATKNNYLLDPQHDKYLLGINSTDSIDDFINQKNNILKTKLDVLTKELHERLDIRERNITSIDWEECKLDTMLHDLYVIGGRYSYNTGKRRTSLDQQYFKIKEDRRKQEVELWRDITLLTKDLLYAWGEYQQAKARTRLLQND